ncbi:hypothetical protein MVEN_01971400 [Mycena venus]|uniref:Cytochrome P450 n=1 Tax=Mycena venus TaxID=2733690 RepID=A0A8H7CK53_9AGAR|nr:hypothetical protein MVEN_01971400 [Mycena venus]
MRILHSTSAVTSWALHALSLHPNVQSKLRTELFTISTENPTMDQLNSLPYLENVIREIMRLHTPLPFVERIAAQDDVLPLSRPYIDRAGKSHDALLIPKGMIIHIPIWTINTDEGTWGEDAGVFKPERWENIPEAVTAIPSVWANLLTFFAGPANCIGFRFSLTEMKALLFTLTSMTCTLPCSALAPLHNAFQTNRRRVLSSVGRNFLGSVFIDALLLARCQEKRDGSTALKIKGLSPGTVRLLMDNAEIIGELQTIMFGLLEDQSCVVVQKKETMAQFARDPPVVAASETESVRFKSAAYRFCVYCLLQTPETRKAFLKRYPQIQVLELSHFVSALWVLVTVIRGRQLETDRDCAYAAVLSRFPFSP